MMHALSPITRAARFLGLVLAAALAGCPSPAVDQRPKEGSPDAGEQLRQPPTWEKVGIERRWLREGHGEVRALAAVDVDGDGDQEIVYGGRGVALLDRAAREGKAPRWSLDWLNDGSVLSGGENVIVEVLALVDVNGDGVADALVLNSDRQAYAVDTVTGQTLWHTKVEVEPGLFTARMATFDGDADGVEDFFPSGGKSAYSGATGEPLWSADLPRGAIFVVAAELDGIAGRDLLITTEMDGCVGVCGPELEQPTPNIHALGSGGALLFRAQVPGTISSATAADLDGDGIAEAVVGTWDGWVHAAGPGGILWSVQLGEGMVGAVSATVVGGVTQVFAGLNRPFHQAGSMVVSLSAQGTLLWTHPVVQEVRSMQFLQLDEDPTPELVVATGGYYPSRGMALALDVVAPPSAREQWRLAVPYPVDSFSLARIDSQEVLLVGAADAVIRALAPATGEGQWSYAGGGFVYATAAGDLTGEGVDAVVSGDARGQVILSSPVDGSRIWSRHADVGSDGVVIGLVIADLTGDGAGEVIVGGMRDPEAQHLGVVEVYRADGSLLFSVQVPGEVRSIQVVDLDGDGAKEIVFAEWRAGACGVTAMGPLGQLLWHTRVNACEIPVIGVGDADGDGKLEIAYGDTVIFGEPVAALLEYQGEIRWVKRFTPEVYESYTWAKVVPGGALLGGYAAARQGHVTFLHADTAAPRWQTLLATEPEPGEPERWLGGGTWHGTLVPDLDGDGVDEVAVTVEASSARLLDGAKGALLWTTRLESLDRPWTERSTGGPIAYVPATETVPGWLAVGQSNSLRGRAQSLALTLEGEVVGRIWMEGEAQAIAPVRFAHGRTGAAVGAGLGVYALEAARAQ